MATASKFASKLVRKKRRNKRLKVKAFLHSKAVEGFLILITVYSLFSARFPSPHLIEIHRAHKPAAATAVAITRDSRSRPPARPPARPFAYRPQTRTSLHP